MQNTKILLQNRDVKLGTSLHNILSDAGYTVLTIKNRRGLLNLANTFKPELMIIEGSIAEKDTPEILKKLKKTLHVKVLATSCDDNRNLLLKKGFDDCLNLPYQTENIRGLIDVVLAA